MESNIADIQKYTVALYREKFREPSLRGSGILVSFQGTKYLISAYHVFDMEEERFQVENDIEEKDIPHDDMESIMAKGVEKYFYIDNDVFALAFSVRCDQNSRQPVFNDDIEWCVCKLTDEMIRFFTESGKEFYPIHNISCPQIDCGGTIIASGYPKYANKAYQEAYRSFRCEALNCNNFSYSALLRVGFDCNNAYNYENKKCVQILCDGMTGMSGGGLWYEKNSIYLPIGIMLRNDPIKNYIEGFRLDLIIKEIQSKYSC